MDKGNQCFEKMVLLSAICHHIPAIANKVAEGSQSFVLARHHFPVSTFDHIGGQKMAVLLSETEIKTLAKEDNSLRLSEECNLVGRMVTSLSGILPKGKLHDTFQSFADNLPAKVAIKYIIAPVETPYGVQSEIGSWLRVRKQRCSTPEPTKSMAPPRKGRICYPALQ